MLAANGVFAADSKVLRARITFSKLRCARTGKCPAGSYARFGEQETHRHPAPRAARTGALRLCDPPRHHHHTRSTRPLVPRQKRVFGTAPCSTRARALGAATKVTVMLAEETPTPTSELVRTSMNRGFISVLGPGYMQKMEDGAAGGGAGR